MMSDICSDLIIKFAQSISGKAQVRSLLKSVRLDVAKMDSGLHTEPRKLEMDLDDQLKQDIRAAHEHLSGMVNAYKFTNLEYHGYGANFMKANKFSPDAFVQQGMMTATYNVCGEMVCGYESVMTKRYLKGRTEAGRPATAEAKAYNELLAAARGGDKSATTEALVESLRLAAKKHSAVTGLASQGQGVDRHLYALKCAWKQKHGSGAKLPEIFSTSAFSKLSTTILSTSNCGNPALKSFGFGPVSEHGVGIGYIIKSDAITFSICSKSIDVDALSSELARTFDSTKLLLKKDAKRKSVMPASLVKRFSTNT
jgi:carnitine O-acetyltransferase